MENKFIKAVKSKLQDIKDERNKVSIAKAVQFAKKNRNCVIFLLDIKSDDFVAAYQDIYMAARMKTKYLKRKTGFVKTIILGHLNEKKRDRAIMFFEQFAGTFLKQISDVVKKSKEKVAIPETKEKIANERQNSDKN